MFLSFRLVKRPLRCLCAAHMVHMAASFGPIDPKPTPRHQTLNLNLICELCVGSLIRISLSVVLCYSYTPVVKYYSWKLLRLLLKLYCPCKCLTNVLFVSHLLFDSEDDGSPSTRRFGFSEVLNSRSQEYAAQSRATNVRQPSQQRKHGYKSAAIS